MLSFLRKIKMLPPETPAGSRCKILRYAILVVALLALELMLFAADRLPISHTRSANENAAALQLQTLSDRIFLYELEGSSLNLHYVLSDPAAMRTALIESASAALDTLPSANLSALDYDQITLPSFSPTQMEQTKQDYNSFLTSMSQIDTSALSATARWYWQVLYASLSGTKDRLQYDYYFEPLSPSSGEQTSLLILLAEYPLRTPKDVSHYLDTLRCIDTYFQDLLFYEQEKAKAGLFMSDTALDKVIAQCDSLCSLQQLEECSHFLQTTFVQRLQQLLAGGSITSVEYKAFCEENNEVLGTVVAPAYSALADGLFLLRGSGNNENGLSAFPDGAAYYSALIRSQTGSGRNPEEILSLLSSYFTADYELLLDAAEQLDENTFTSEFRLPFSGAEEMLTDLITRMEADFPSLPPDIHHEIKAVAGGLTAYVSPAYYLTPPIDAIQQNSIYINYGNAPDDLTLYTTLAHEGYPGHLYQTTWHLHDLSEHADRFFPLSALLSFTGFSEGWATYVEDLAYTYAAKSLPESADATDAAYIEYCRLSRQLQLCLLSMLDVSIHYYGMELTEASALLQSFGIGDSDTIREIYEYIVEEPGNYLNYCLGYLEILELKKEAASAWGTGYSNLRFHTFLLKNGPAPYAMLRNALLSSAAENNS